jgi:hypothetical protein
MKVCDLIARAAVSCERSLYVSSSHPVSKISANNQPVERLFFQEEDLVKPALSAYGDVRSADDVDAGTLPSCCEQLHQ